MAKLTFSPTAPGKMARRWSRGPERNQDRSMTVLLGSVRNKMDYFWRAKDEM